MADQQPTTWELLAAAAVKVLPGALGAIVSLRMLPSDASWAHRITALVGGVAASAYGAPAMAEAFDLASPRIEAFSAFAIGLFGMALAGEIHAALHESQLGLILRDWARRVLRLDRG